jgi:Fic family protein
VRRAVAEPDEYFTAKAHAHSHRVSGETARQDLLDLESRGYLDRSKIGKQFAWRPAADLSARLHRR